MLLASISHSCRRWIAAPLLLAAVALMPHASSAMDPTPPEGQREYVNSVSDYVVHMEAHIQRVVTIGTDMAEHFPEFKTVNQDLLRKYLSLHDETKTLNWEKPGSVARRLYKFYGKNVKAVSPELAAEFEATIKELNLRDKRISDKFLKENHLLLSDGKLTPEGLLFLRIEKDADQVDRVLCRVSTEEWNKFMEPASTSDWLKNEADKKIAAHYERPQLDENGKLMRHPDGQAILDRRFYEALTADGEFNLFRLRKLADCVRSGLRASEPIHAPHLTH